MRPRSSLPRKAFLTIQLIPASSLFERLKSEVFFKFIHSTRMLKLASSRKRCCSSIMSFLTCSPESALIDSIFIKDSF